MLNIALPKGRLVSKAAEIFTKIGLNGSVLEEKNRKLVITDEEKGLRYFLVKPSDVAIYVEKGAADAGIVGKDILLETQADVYELLDLKIGKCTMSVAAPNDYRENRDKILRVATTFPNIAKKYYEDMNREIELIRLNGSVELAPLLNLSDVIVDIVETGSTLRENNMSVIGEITDISARFITNKSASKFKGSVIDDITKKLEEVIK